MADARSSVDVGHARQAGQHGALFETGLGLEGLERMGYGVQEYEVIVRDG